jgi:hypothetical protein
MDNILKESFMFLEKNIKELSETNFKDYRALRKDSLNRINDTINFINSNIIKDYNLEDIKNELISLQQDFNKFTNEILSYEKVNYFDSLIPMTHSYIDASLRNIEKELVKSKQKTEDKSYKKSDEKINHKVDNSNTIKVKVFKSAFSEEIEDSLNKFLSENDIEITDRIQSIENNTICITVFYKLNSRNLTRWKM